MSNHLVNQHLIDRQGRRITYLRLSVTDRCNLKCIYCVSRGDRELIPHDEILRHEEMLRIVKILAGRGVEKVRITGGEPLLRKNLLCLVSEIKKISGIREISLTTNGVLLADMADDLKKAGISRINISLDSLKRDVFHYITGSDCLPSVVSGIEAAIRAGMFPVRINAVAISGVNDGEIEDLAGLSLNENIHVRFIEEMPIGSCSHDKKAIMAASDIREILESRWGSLIPVLPSSFDGPARRFRIQGAKGEVGFISSMTGHFCGTCNRIRLTAKGDIRPCLLDDTAVNLKTQMRNGAGDELLTRLIEDAIDRKNPEHEKMPQVETLMVSIGG